MNPLRPLLDAQDAVILDGGFATELQAHGLDLADELWSAGALLDQSDVVRQVHLDYLLSGADCIIASTYQATEEGFLRRGLRGIEARSLLRRAVLLAVEERDLFWTDEANRSGRLRPLVAASVGPYGAYLADGSEYRGDYDLDEEHLLGFHRHRFAVLAASGADLLACETLPSLVEVRALRRLLEETPGVWAWFSFSCRDEGHLADGTSVEEAAAALDGTPRLAAIGVNCTAPRFVPEIVARLRATSDLPIAAYPNSGRYDLKTKTWFGESLPGAFADVAYESYKNGARLLGGCCHTGPGHVRAIRRRLLGEDHSRS